MKEYESVFRNIKTTRRFDTGAYRNYREPGWVQWVGGFIAGCIFALLIFLGI